MGLCLAGSRFSFSSIFHFNIAQILIFYKIHILNELTKQKLRFPIIKRITSERLHIYRKQRFRFGALAHVFAASQCKNCDSA